MSTTLGETGSKLWFAVILTAGIFVAEIVGGILSGSLALVSDSVHVLLDASALGLSLFALYLGTRPPTEFRTYGLHRAEVFAAVANGLTLFIAAGIILYEAYRRLFVSTEVAVHAEWMTLVAFLGLVANGVVLIRLGRNHHTHGHNHCDHESGEEHEEEESSRAPRDLNLHSAYLHVASDLLASVAVVAGGALIWGFGPRWAVLDPILAAVIGLLILVGAGRVLYEASHILLEGVPRGLKLPAVAETMAAIPRVKDVHHLHVWSICSNITILSAHVVVDDADMADHIGISRQINRALYEKFRITDTTIQIESLSQETDTLIHQLDHPDQGQKWEDL